MQKQLSVAELMTRFGRKEQTYKSLGLHAHAEAVRSCIVEVCRMADEGEPSLDQSEPIEGE